MTSLQLSPVPPKGWEFEQMQDFKAPPQPSGISKLQERGTIELSISPVTQPG